jgi:hypothetical protein
MPVFTFRWAESPAGSDALRVLDGVRRDREVRPFGQGEGVGEEVGEDQDRGVDASVPQLHALLRGRDGE